MELTSLRNAIVGLPGVTGLSVEQRKRLTIGVELVSNPGAHDLVQVASSSLVDLQLLQLRIEPAVSVMQLSSSWTSQHQVSKLLRHLPACSGRPFRDGIICQQRCSGTRRDSCGFVFVGAAG